MAIRISAELSHLCPLDEISTHAAALEAHGFFRLWVPDTVVSPWEAWLAASIIMQTTRHVQIGLGVTNPYTRHPVVMAQMAATMQRCSGERLTLSVGEGHWAISGKGWYSAVRDGCRGVRDDCASFDRWRAYKLRWQGVSD